jgi:antitoxin component of MazEF toxin-antitoxin module
MTTTISVSKVFPAGKGKRSLLVVLPKALCEQLQIHSGSFLVVKLDESRVVLEKQ